ncbi:uncharacterized protein LOC133779619 [Humulus lupulus]|uniref:uncharacterized protein LOC133779619 n=1 Tax=Humulus lupulus TaxID=3486 RepID=UPI002B403E38|nr:uncharacterized protein LOC133779619 [Humulus lupulus]
MHKILFEEKYKPSIENQRSLNTAMKEVVRAEVLKLLNVGIIYAISYSSWVSLVQVVPEKQEDDNVSENECGPLDPNMQYSHDMMRYIVQQNTITHNYLAARGEYEHNQVDQLNFLVAQWTLNRGQNNYFSYPPSFDGMQDQPPPPPY